MQYPSPSPFHLVSQVVVTRDTGVTLAKNDGELTVPVADLVPVNVTVTAYFSPCACGDPEKVKIVDGPPAGTPTEGLRKSREPRSGYI
jgi:hypothetical protein